MFINVTTVADNCDLVEDYINIDCIVGIHSLDFTTKAKKKNPKYCELAKTNIHLMNSQYIYVNETYFEIVEKINECTIRW